MTGSFQGVNQRAGATEDDHRLTARIDIVTVVRIAATGDLFQQSADVIGDLGAVVVAGSCPLEYAVSLSSDEAAYSADRLSQGRY